MKITDKILVKEAQEAEKEREMFEYVNNLKKKQLIAEIKNGLGGEIKKHGGKVILVKKPWYIKIKTYIKKIFTKL